VQTARLVATARLADAQGDLAGAAKAYEEAVEIEDALAYMEPPYWYYRSASRWARCTCGRASSMRPKRRFATRWCACAVMAGAGGLAEVYKARAMQRRGLGARLTRGPGSAARHPTSPGCSSEAGRCRTTSVTARADFRLGQAGLKAVKINSGAVKLSRASARCQPKSWRLCIRSLASIHGMAALRRRIAPFVVPLGVGSAVRCLQQQSFIRRPFAGWATRAMNDRNLLA